MAIKVQGALQGLGPKKDRESLNLGGQVLRFGAKGTKDLIGRDCFPNGQMERIAQGREAADVELD